MTRVTDVAPFVQDVADAGALPLVALALMQPDAVEKLLRETAERLAGKPWGVGVLGFAPSDLIAAQVKVALRYAPRFALIAGGRPEQAKDLEDLGITSYLHVPSPRLLTMFLERGARRFVLEGRECGGHVGPLSSRVLWDTMISTLLRQPADPTRDSEIHSAVCRRRARRALRRDRVRHGGAAGRARHEDRRADGHRLSVHARDRPLGRDRSGVPECGDRLRRRP